MVPSFPGMNAQRLTFTRVLAAIGVLAIVVYLGAIVWLIANETRLVFRPDEPFGQRRPAAPFEELDWRAAGAAAPDGRVWLMPSGGGDRPWVVFLHGNDANLSSRMNILHYERLRALG